MATDSKKKRVYASNAVLYALFVVGAIVVVNLISTRYLGPLRVDLTESKIYTLSQPSKDLVKKLPDYLTVKAFISDDLPPELNAVSRYIRDLVDEYKTSSNGKFRWEAIDPGKDKKLEEEANRCRVQKTQIQRIASEKFEVGAYYLGLCLEYGGQIESIPQVVRQEGLEYQMSSLIKKMTQKKKKIAFTTGHGESDINMGFQALKEQLEQEFEITSVNPSSAEIGADIDALVVGGPKQAIDEKGQKEIDKFIMKGKGAIFLLDGMALSSPGGGGMEQMQIKMAQANDHGLGKLIEAYGFKVNQDFVFDEQAMPGPLNVGGRPVLVSAPFFVGAELDKNTKGLIVVEGLRGLVMPFASSVELTGPLTGGKPPQGGKLWKIASSTSKGWKHTGFFVLSAEMKIDEPKERGAQAFGYAYQGTVKSAFAPAAAPAAESSLDKPAGESAKPVRLLVMGDSDFANDEYVQLSRFFPYYAAGAHLLLNAVGWTVEDEALAPLRSKNVNPRPIQVTDGKRLVLQSANVVGLPLALCLYGIVRWRVRRATRLGQKL